MKIQYIGNTCDVSGLGGYGEIMIMVKDGVPVAHHDYSDDALNLDYVAPLLAPFGIEVEFEQIDKPSKKLIAAVKEYLKPIYGEPSEE